ncbi:MAG: M48 family metalloprotease [Archangiaceae bacterium]|nr:M48 family metalloprotease [Archangiaceae bacterium]
MFRALARWLFRLWLMPLAGLAVLRAGLSLVFTPRSEPLLEAAVREALSGEGATVLPALLASFDRHLYHHEHDGPGWSDQQLPRLWSTVRALAEKMGCPPPDALHLSVEPGNLLAWCSKSQGGPLRRHVALSLLDLRLLSLDEARAVMAHEIAHAGFEHSLRNELHARHAALMEAVIEALPFPLGLPVHLARALHALGEARGAHDDEREADRRAALAVGGNHVASALRRTYLGGPALARVFALVLSRAEAGPRVPLRLAEAAFHLYRGAALPSLERAAAREAQVPGPHHPSLPDRVAQAEGLAPKSGIGPGTPFIDAYPELLAAEELLTQTYFPGAPAHARSDASTLKRRALAARLGQGRR